MIIKIPIYFDISGVSQEDLPEFVAELTTLSYKEARRAKISTLQFSPALKKKANLIEATLKVISKEQAIEHLRSGS